MSQIGGADGELTASLRYLHQRYAMPTDEIKGLLTDIGTEESVHIETEINITEISDFFHCFIIKMIYNQTYAENAEKR